MSESTLQKNGPQAPGASAPLSARPPAKVPVKVPYALLGATPAPLLPTAAPALRRREGGDAAASAVATAAKRQRREGQTKARRAVSESSTDSSSSSDSDDDDDDSDSDSRSVSRSSDSNDGSSSSYSSASSKDTETDSAESEEHLTLLQMAKADGLVDKNVNHKEEVEEEEVAPVGPPPRPPVVRSFPQNIDAALQRYEERLNREENMIRIRDDNKAVSLGTSKVNYIDPRIVCSWAKEHNVPIAKIFSATLQKKFPWAMGAENFSF